MVSHLPRPSFQMTRVGVRLRARAAPPHQRLHAGRAAFSALGFLVAAAACPTRLFVLRRAAGITAGAVTASSNGATRTSFGSGAHVWSHSTGVSSSGGGVLLEEQVMEQQHLSQNAAAGTIGGALDTGSSASRRLDFLRVDVLYSQTAGRAPLPGEDELLDKYLEERSSAGMLDDMARGRGDWVVEDVDREAQEFIINHPSGKWVAPGGLGTVNLTGPILEITLVDRTEPWPFPRARLPSWHRAKCRIHAKLQNGIEIIKAELRLPFVPPIRFNVSGAGEFEMELGFAGSGNSEGASVLLGANGTLGVSLPRLPGAGTLISMFCPAYIRKAMQQAAEGLALTYAKQHRYE